MIKLNKRKILLSLFSIVALHFLIIAISVLTFQARKPRIVKVCNLDAIRLSYRIEVTNFDDPNNESLEV